jgi:predicted nucleic acid-binding protein
VTAVKVVDASALAALLFSEPEADAVASRLTNARLAAPRLLTFELANVCVVKSRRHVDQRDALFAAFCFYERLGVEEMDVDAAAVVRLALAKELTAYDAAYLWLAQQLGAELVTLDNELQRALGR